MISFENNPENTLPSDNDFTTENYSYLLKLAKKKL